METEIDLKSIIGLVRRQIWLILVTIGVVLILTAIVTYSITPKYQATALVLVDTSTKNLLDSQNSYQNASADNARVESEVGILRSDRIIMNVVRENNLVSDEEFGVRLGLKDRLFTMLRLPASQNPSESDALAGVLNRFRNAVSVSRSGLTYLISVGVQSEDPEKAARLANSMTDIYIREQIGSKVSSTMIARNTLQNRVAAANTAIVENERSFDNYINANLARIEEETRSAGLTGLRSQMESLAALRQEQSNRLEQVRQSIASRDFESINSVLQSEAIAELERQRQELADRLAATGADRPDAVNLRAELSRIESQLEENVTTQAEELQKSVAAYQQQADELRQQLRSTVLQSNLPPEILTEIYSLQQSAEIARNQYQSLLARLQELDAQTDLQLPDSRVVSAALAPSSPSYPRKNLIHAVAFLAALGLGVGLAIMREHFIGGFTSEDQVETVLRTPLAAITPREAMAEENGKAGHHSASVADLMVTAPLTIYAESVRRLRLALDQAERRNRPPALAESENSRGSIILVTSSVPNEGKSTLALSLARAYALTGQRTLLIDCDLRKPSVNRYLNLNPSHDFIDYLRDDVQGVSLASLTMRDPMTNLTVLLGGRRSDIATDELVMSEKMTRILNSARRHFDYIVLDTPPIEPVVDALYLARHADMIAFVLKWASTPQSSAKRSIAALRDNKNPDAEIITILNQQDRNKAAGYYAYSGYYNEK